MPWKHAGIVHRDLGNRCHHCEAGRVPVIGLQGLPSRDARGRPSWPGLGRSHRPLRRPLGRRVRRGADPPRGARSRDIRDFRVTCGIREVRVWPTIQGILAPARERPRVPSRRPRQPSLACRASALRLQASTFAASSVSELRGQRSHGFHQGLGEHPNPFPKDVALLLLEELANQRRQIHSGLRHRVNISVPSFSGQRENSRKDARWRLFLSTPPGSSNFHHELGL